jgi:DNA-binding PadR family transcriptional regulator
MKHDDVRDLLPLSPAVLHILLALSAEDRHGYGIMREVERQSEGQYKLGPGTLYDNLQKLMDRGLVKEIRKSSANEDPRRRYYRLTRVGRQILEADLERLKRVLREARLRLSVREPANLS